MFAYIPLIRLRYLPTDGEDLGFFWRCQPSFGVKGASHLLTTHLMTRLSKQSTPLVPRYLGDPLFIESPVAYQWSIPLPVIGPSSFIFVPGFCLPYLATTADLAAQKSNAVRK